MNELQTRKLMFQIALASSLFTAVAILSLLTFMGALNLHPWGTLSVREIRLIDQKGQVCGKLGTREDGASYIHLGGFGREHLENVGPQFWVEASPYAPRDGGQVRLHIGSPAMGYMRLSNNYGNAGPLMYMVNAQGKGALAAGIWGKNGEGYLRIDDYDPNQKGVLSTKHVGEKIDGVSMMVVDKEGKATWTPPSTK